MNEQVLFFKKPSTCTKHSCQILNVRRLVSFNLTHWKVREYRIGINTSMAVVLCANNVKRCGTCFCAHRSSTSLPALLGIVKHENATKTIWIEYFDELVNQASRKYFNKGPSIPSRFDKVIKALKVLIQCGGLRGDGNTERRAQCKTVAEHGHIMWYPFSTYGKWDDKSWKWSLVQ